MPQARAASAPSGSEFLRLLPLGPAERRASRGLFSSGVESECDLREIAHPEGRFRRADGTRYDLCVMELAADPGLRPPGVSREHFVGDAADTRATVIRLGNVRQSSFRLRLISPGHAFGTVTVQAKSTVPDILR